MTRNQIDFWKAVVESADRQRNLEENTRHNKVTESLTMQTNAEQRRANLAREAETSRSNLANERETARANLAREVETSRSNRAREEETKRSNMANESLKNQQVAAQVASNLEQARHNQAVESENYRANVAAESLTSQRNAETIRSNVASEAIDRSRVGETYRANNMSNAIDTYNAVTQRYRQEADKVYQAQSSSINRANYQETARHNAAMEEIEKRRTTVSAVTSVASTLGNVIGRGLGSLIGRSGRK